ncbi:MAG: hypothetical protein M3290_04900, partial [Actinomycetota bacterium]|nr:hypothetical protein [Actinomycetota bacterium]
MQRSRYLLGSSAVLVGLLAVVGVLAPAGQRPATADDTLYGAPKISKGVRAVAYHPGRRLITSGRALRSRPHSYLIRTGYGGWEPTLGVASDGTVVYAARNTNVDSRVIRSTNGGHTWRDITPSVDNRHVASLDPFLWLDEKTDTVFDSDIDPSITCPPMSVSAVKDVQWST